MNTYVCTYNTLERGKVNIINVAMGQCAIINYEEKGGQVVSSQLSVPKGPLIAGSHFQCELQGVENDQSSFD
jgi:hypothetical protein